MFDPNALVAAGVIAAASLLIYLAIKRSKILVRIELDAHDMEALIAGGEVRAATPHTETVIRRAL